MKAQGKEYVEYSLHMKSSGAQVLREIAKFSKTIGKTVAAKEGLDGDEAKARTGQIKRTLRRVRLALEAAGA